ncbi:MAG TPA: AAA family ATPase [Actinomycetota bacterium]|nr:AAA family ATPase [Actinomycetota bacterium]
MGGGAVREAARKRAPEPGAAMSPAFVVTEAKLFRPPVRPGIVRRNALVQRLRNAETASVVAITAPAGYGKTTLLAEWAERDRRPFAWVSVDEADGDPVVFLGHVAVALDRIEPLGPHVLESIASPTGANSTRVLSRLSSALATRTRPFVLVLDDVDRLGDPLDAVSSIADHVPKGSVLALAARAVPDVGLPRLRADGRLIEVGIDDLALRPPQAYRLLHGAGVRTTKDEAAELADATEGWPVGLYLAALSLQEQRRSTLPPIRFTGDDRFVVDYVRSEVLGRLSRERQRFLTRTSILDRLNGSVCDAVMQRSGSARTLESIERQNLLLVPLDRQREWFRYHNLFRDVLRAELARREPDAIPDLHRRAADRFEEAGMLEEAFVHAHASGDVDRAAGLLQRVGLVAYRVGRIASLRRWLDLLGEDAIARNNGLALMAAWIAALGGDPVAAERWTATADDVGLAGPSLHGTASLRSTEAMVHATMSLGGVDAMVRAAEVAVREETGVSPYRAAALGLLGLATMIRGDDDLADSLFADASEVGIRIGGMPVASLALAERSLIATSRGEGAAAEDLAERARFVVREAHLDEHITTGPVHVASARAALRAGDHDGARAELAAAHRLRPILTWAFPTIAVQTRLELARVHVGLSDGPGARTLLAEVDEILAHRPDLGTLTTQAVELRTHIGSVRSGWSPGPTTLTAAELRLLTFLPTHLSFREIGARLFISPNTVKTQAISIYRKLGVSTRSDAVQAARDLRLLET